MELSARVAQACFPVAAAQALPLASLALTRPAKEWEEGLAFSARPWGAGEERSAPWDQPSKQGEAGLASWEPGQHLACRGGDPCPEFVVCFEDVPNLFLANWAADQLFDCPDAAFYSVRFSDPVPEFSASLELLPPEVPWTRRNWKSGIVPAPVDWIAELSGHPFDLLLVSHSL